MQQQQKDLDLPPKAAHACTGGEQGSTTRGIADPHPPRTPKAAHAYTRGLPTRPPPAPRGVHKRRKALPRFSGREGHGS